MIILENNKRFCTERYIGYRIKIREFHRIAQKTLKCNKKGNIHKVPNRLRGEAFNMSINKIKKIWDAVTTVLVAVVIILALLLAGVRLVGLQVFSVLSGSMEPTYHVGSLIYVKTVDYTELESGDVITFMLDEETVATHRIVEVVPDEEDSTVLRYRTKGDANDAEDGSLVHYKNVIGTPVFTIPKLGYLADYIQNPPGMYLAISAGAILLILVILPDIFASDEESKKKRKKKGAQQEAASEENERG